MNSEAEFYKAKYELLAAKLVDDPVNEVEALVNLMAVVCQLNDEEVMDAPITGVIIEDSNN